MEERINYQIKKEKIKSLKSFFENVEDKDCFFGHIADIELMHEKSLIELKEKLKSFNHSISRLTKMLSEIL